MRSPWGDIGWSPLSCVGPDALGLLRTKGYSRNPCSLNRVRDAAFAAKLLTLPTGFFSAEKSEEWMARSPV